MYLRPLWVFKNAARSTQTLISPSLGSLNQTDQRRWKNNLSQTTYLDSRDRDLRLKQRIFPKLNPWVYIERKEVETYDGFKIVEGLIDASQKPHELNLVKKVAGLKGEPHWIKKALLALGFNIGRSNEWQVVYNVHPNTARINEYLWICKHLVKVTPIKFKNGYPTNKDLANSRLNLETGEFEIIKPLESFTADGGRLDCYMVNGVVVSEDLKPGDNFPLDKSDLKRDFQRRYELKRLNDEYFPAVYNWTMDQDKPGVVRLPGKPNTDVNEDDPDPDETL